MTTSINKNSYPDLFGPITNYAILARTGITSATTTTVNNGVYGNLGGSLQITGTFNGTQNNEVTNANFDLTQLVSNINNIYANSSINVIPYTGGNRTFLSSTSAAKEVYASASSITCNAGTTLTFDAQNNPNAQFFIIALTSMTFNSTTFVLANGALAQNIFFSTAGNTGTTIGFTGTTTVGGVFIAGTAITFGGVSTINGNLFIQNTDRGTNVTFAANSIVNAPTVCYLKGTKVLTDGGYVAVEDLSVGDKVITHGNIVDNLNVDKYDKSKTKSVLWTGNFKPSELNEYSLPICVKAGAISENVPFEDLYVSPGHRIVVDGKLVLATELINGSTVFQVDSLDSVEYYHFELESHLAVLVNGVASESYFDTDPTHRLIFDNQKF
jgi:hypothetical protein